MRSVIVSCALLFTFSSFALSKPDRGPNDKSGDWPQWRGPNRDGICTETGLLKEWPKEGPKLLWDAKKVNGGQSVGAGMASMAIVQGKLFTLGHLKGQGHAFCLNADTGREIWKTKLSGGGSEPRSTPTVDGAHLYFVTQSGRLFCVKTADGAIVWQKDDIFKEFHGGAEKERPGFGGYAESLTIDGDKLICAPGGKKCMVALNKLSGDVYWTCDSPKANGSGYGFCSIVKTEVGGVKMYITLGNNQLGLIGVDAESGKLLWNYNKVANGTASVPTPIVQREYVFASTGYGTGSTLLKLVADGKGGIQAQEQYFLKGGKLQNHHGGLVMLGDYIYGGHGHNDGLPFCLAWKTGKMVWGPERGPGEKSAAVLYADGMLYFRYETGEMALIEATPNGYNPKGSFRPDLTKPGWQHPVIYHGRLYLRGNNQILCYDIKQK